MSTLLDAQTEVHVQLGNGAPSFLPTAIGQHYIDIANKRVYQSTGINDLEDWGEPLATITDVAAIASQLNKEQLGLGEVENYGVATKEEAEAGELNSKYMTPLRVVDLLNALFMPAITAFQERTDNPHAVTAAQTGAYTIEEVDGLLTAKLNEGDLAGLLNTFWATKVGEAPETLDTIEEISRALQDNPDVITALQGLVEGNRLTLVDALADIAALQAAVGESTAFLTAESDLGVNPVALASDASTVEVPVLVASNQENGEVQISRTGEVVTVLVNVEGTYAEAGSLDVDTQAAVDDYLASAAEGDFSEYFTVGTTNREVTAEARDLKAILDSLEAKDAAQDQALASAVAALNSQLQNQGIASADAIEAVSDALDAFIAAKASGAEAIAGEDDAKYITALALKAALDALDLSGKLDVGAQAVDSALLAGQTLQQVLDLARDGVDMSNVVLKTDDMGQYKVVLSSDIVTEDIPASWAVNVGMSNLSAGFVEGVLFLEQDVDSLVFTSVLDQYSAAEQASLAAALEALYPGETNFRTTVNFIPGVEAGEVIGGKTLKEHIEGLMADIAALESNKLDATAQAADSALLEGSTKAEITGPLQTAIDDLVTRSDDRDTELDGIITDLRAAIELAGDASDLEDLSDRLDAFIAAKATSAEAIAGEDDAKYVTALALKAAVDAHWADKVGAAPETLDTIEELAAALRDAPDALDALELVAKNYTDQEVLAAIAQISGEDMEAGTTLASLYADIQALSEEKLDATATAVNSEKLQGKTLMEVIDAAIQPGRLFYPVVHVNGHLDEEDYTMPTPAAVWATIKTDAVLEQVDTVYAIAVKRLLPGNLLALTSQEGMTLVGAVSAAQEGPEYVLMSAGVEDTEWTIVNEPMLGCLARLSKHCVVVGENTERFVPGQTLFYNGFEALTDGVYFDWSVLADKEWEVATFTGTELVIDSSRYHRSEIRIQSVEPVTVTFDVETDLPYEMEMRFVNNTGVAVTFEGTNVTSVPRMEAYTMTRVNGVVRMTRYTNAAVAVFGDLDEAFFENPDFEA